MACDTIIFISTHILYLQINCTNSLITTEQTANAVCMRSLNPMNASLHFFVAKEIKRREMKPKQQEPCIVQVMLS